MSDPTAWLRHHKIKHDMAEQDRCGRLDGTVHLDDASLGGERSGGKVGRSSENTVPFVAAVSINAEVHPLCLKANRVSGFTSEAIGPWARASWWPTTLVSATAWVAAPRSPMRPASTRW